MKKLALFGIVLFLLAVGLVFAISMSKEQREQINDCRLDCNDERRASQKECQEEGRACTDSCTVANTHCIDIATDELNACTSGCIETFSSNSSLSTLQKRELQKNQYACKKECQRNFSMTKRIECNIGQCKRECAKERSECVSLANEEQRFCSQSCQYLFLNSSITCENGKYHAGQTIWRDCDSCFCGFDGKLSCKKHASCNFKGMNETSQEQCEDAGGFYQELCQGNIYAMRCTEEFYCQCSGFNEYTCPENQICLKEFKTHGILSGNLNTWSERRGVPLGDIGICAPIPEIESCGNGVCNDVVVNGIAETKLNCAVDCENPVQILPNTHECGNSICEDASVGGNEAIENCPEDCWEKWGIFSCEYDPDRAPFQAPKPCPTVCRPMWVLQGSTCTFTTCGSGCGANNLSTFCEVEQCKANIGTQCQKKVLNLDDQQSDLCSRAISVGYEYDSNLGKCVQKEVAGCNVYVPFKTLIDCQNHCDD